MAQTIGHSHGKLQPDKGAVTVFVSFKIKDVLEELDVEDLIRELQRREVPVDALAAHLDPQPRYRGHVHLHVSTYAALENLDDDELIEEVRDRDLERTFGPDIYDDDLDQQDIDALAMALHANNTDRVLELSRRWVESRTGRIIN